MKICFLMEQGDPPRLNPIFADTFASLEKSGVEVVIHFPEQELFRVDALSVEADLYCLKSDTEMAMSLATVLDGMGARLINSLDATLLAKEKVSAAYILARAGIPTPCSVAAARPVQLQSDLRRAPLILKPHRGYHGAGIKIVTGTDDTLDDTAYPGFVFAQEYLGKARTDLKVYVVGEHIFGVQKKFSGGSFLQSGTPTLLSEELKNIARRCGVAFGLELYGLDIAEDSTGAYVVDVNYFPGYRGVPNVSKLLTDHLLRALRN